MLSAAEALRRIRHASAVASAVADTLRLIRPTSDDKNCQYRPVMNTLDQKTLLAAIHPFSSLTELQLEKILNAMDLAYYPSGQTVIAAGMVPEQLYLIVKGLVQELDEDNAVVNVFGPQDMFDAISLIKGENPRQFVAKQELICHVLPKNVFIGLIQAHKEFGEFFYQDISGRLDKLLELRNHRQLSSFMVAKVADAYIQPPVFVEATDSIYHAVKIMRANQQTAILVKKDGQMGIMTESDISNKVILQRLSVDTPVDEIATYKTIAVAKDDFLFNAKLLMTTHSIKRVLVRDGENVAGILDQVHLFSYFADHSGLADIQIERAENMAQLQKASVSLLAMVQSLSAKGVKIEYISRLMNELNKKIFIKLYQFIMPTEMLHNACMAVMGSEGRAEQILKTDQDNAIILRDGFSHPDLPALAQQWTQYLLELGYPLCAGQIMASNPLWRNTLSEWKNKLYQWYKSGNEEAILNLAIFFDASAPCGDIALLEDAKAYLRQHAQGDASFLSRFARATLAFETPLNWLEHFVVERNQHKNQLDIKKGGIFAVVHGIRSLALEYNVHDTNTLDRIRQLAALGTLEMQFSRDLAEAFSIMNWLRLQSGLEKIYQGLPADNYITPGQLNKMERDLLKDAFKLVEQFKKLITHHYRLQILG